MAPQSISIVEAAEGDALALASVMTASYSASDASFPLIYDAAPPGTHDRLAVQFLFTPVQTPNRKTFKAVDDNTGRLVGFASWSVPIGAEVPTALEGGDEELAETPGINTALWLRKMSSLGSPPRSSDTVDDIGVIPSML